MGRPHENAVSRSLLMTGTAQSPDQFVFALSEEFASRALVNDAAI